MSTYQNKPQVGIIVVCVDGHSVRVLDNKNITKVSQMKGDSQTMSDFGSNNLVAHVHVLYLNVGQNGTKKVVVQLGGWATPKCGILSTQNWPT